MIYCVKRHPGNCDEVNEFFSRLYKKSYIGTGRTHEKNHNYMCYPPVRNNKVVVNYQLGTLITLKQLKEKIKMENFDPQNWFIRITHTNRSLVRDWMESLGEKARTFTLGAKYGYVNGELGTKSSTTMLEKHFFDNIQELSTEEFKTLVMAQKKIIGYELESLEYEEAVKLMIDSNLSDGYSKDLILKYENCPNSIDKLKNACVLDKWFKPVYEEVKPKLPTINNYKGEDLGSTLKYGCAVLEKSWFTSSENRSIKSITLSSDVSIDENQIKQIRKYLDYLKK